MNNLETLVREYAYVNTTVLEIFLSVLVGFGATLVLTTFFEDEDCCLPIVLLAFIVVSASFYFIFFGKSEKSIDLKKEYNVSLEEKQSKLELSYNRKDSSSADVKNKFKVVFTKDNEENYYVYFDEKADEKKTISFKEIQQFVKGSVDYEYYEALENFKIKDLAKNKNKQKEETSRTETDKTTIEQLQKQLDELKKKENTKKETSDKEIDKNSTEQLQKQLDELKKKIDKKNTDE